MTVGENIRKLRKEHGLTQQQLGDLCGIKAANIRKYELDKANPKIETIERIAKALHVPIRKIKSNITWEEYADTEEIRQLDRRVQLDEGIIATIEKIYGKIEDKGVMADDGWESHYYLVGTPPNTFILFEDDIELIANVTRANIPLLVNRIKETRPEQEIIAELLHDLNKLKTSIGK